MPSLLFLQRISILEVTNENGILGNLILKSLYYFFAFDTSQSFPYPFNNNKHKKRADLMRPRRLGSL